MSLSSAELKYEHVPPSPESEQNPGGTQFGDRDADSQLRQQVAERLAAHRARRSRLPAPDLLFPDAGPTPVKSRANRIAEAVAERYAQSQSYREFLAAEAQRAIEEANAAAEIAARNAQAVTAIQQQFLEDLEDWPTQPQIQTQSQTRVPHPFSQPHREIGWDIEQNETALLQPPHPEPASQSRNPNARKIQPRPQKIEGLTVRLYEDLGPLNPAARALPVAQHEPLLDFAHSHEGHNRELPEEALLLDEEIAFRHDPVFEEPAGPPQPIPANLIEFPRQLVASRKSRPRLAEGPLREEADASPAAAQLRIFEVDADQIATVPEPESSIPEWATIRLDAPAEQPIDIPETTFALPPQVAPLSLRLMAAAVDACILAFTFLGFVTLAAFTAHQLPSGPIAAATAAGAFLLLFLLYQTLFFTVADATPGMRYARIALCTFSDENPTRSAMRRRTFAVVLAACPIGIGFLWALLDDDRMGWHDRISRMYQRSY